MLNRSRGWLKESPEMTLGVLWMDLEFSVDGPGGSMNCLVGTVGSLDETVGNSDRSWILWAAKEHTDRIDD